MDVRVRQFYKQYSVGRQFNTRTGAQHEFCFTSLGAVLTYTVRNKLKGQRKTIKFGSDTSEGPSLPPHSLSLKNFLVRLSV